MVECFGWKPISPLARLSISTTHLLIFFSIIPPMSLPNTRLIMMFLSFPFFFVSPFEYGQMRLVAQLLGNSSLTILLRRVAVYLEIKFPFKVFCLQLFNVFFFSQCHLFYSLLNIFFHEDFFLYSNFRWYHCLCWIFMQVSHMRLPLGQRDTHSRGCDRI